MRIAVIGGGAAGLTAAGSAKGADVVLFEHGEKVGKKIYITGKGRCNFTNVCDADTFLSNVVVNPSFLRSALYRFSPEDAVKLLNDNGCATKVERGRRAFPLSDKASDVTKVLTKYALSNGVDIRTGVHITDISRIENGFSVKYDGGSENFDRVIICTGGKSYPSTGSDGSAYGILKKLGHSVVTPVPSLVALVTREDLSAAEGLTLKNVSISADGIKPIFGDMMITDRGISGPIVLTLSALLARREFPYVIRLDFKPTITEQELDARLLRDFGERLNKCFKNALDDLLPKAVIPYVIDRADIPPDRRVNSVTKQERKRIADVVKSFEITVTGNEGFDRAVVTSGGVNVKEIDPKTMQSRIVRGLYFGGEVIDVDALTGGYNFHIALATGYVAGTSAIGEI